MKVSLHTVFIRVIGFGLISTVMAAHAYATTSQCYEWTSFQQTGWHKAAEIAAQARVNWCNANKQPCGTNANCEGDYSCTTSLHDLVMTTFPAYDVVYKVVSVYQPTAQTYTSYTPNATMTVSNLGCKVYASATPPPEGCSVNSVADPINPATCSVYASERDISATNGLDFKRYYNSKDSSSSNLSAGWRHSFSRTVKPVHSGSLFQPYSENLYNSSLYDAEEQACTSGFAEIQPRISTWANATASYTDGACLVKVGNTTVAQLSMQYTDVPTPAPDTTVLIGYDARRDNGQLVRFTIQAGAIVAPPGETLTLQQTGSGYTLRDASDTAETYDSSGKLLSITGRLGVAQTMSYDAANRLSMVQDSFGHVLVLTYDNDGRLSAVTQQ